jgi:coenzyme PQQ precursor peptide PqqA
VNQRIALAAVAIDLDNEGRSIETDPIRLPTRRDAMWTKPEFTEMRFGFEVTMYIYNR